MHGALVSRFSFVEIKYKKQDHTTISIEKVMKTIEEDDDYSNGSSPCAAESFVDDLLSEAGSSVFMPLDETAKTNLLGVNIDSEGDSGDEDMYTYDASPSFISKQTSTTDSEEENEMIEKALTEMDNKDGGDNSSDLGEIDKKYDLGGKYDLGSAISPTLTTAPKYDLGAFLNPATDSSVPDSRQDGHSQSMSTKTPHRSGSTVYILHKWMADRDWNAARAYLGSADQNDSRLQASVSYKNDDGETSLHIACRKRAPVDIVRIIIDIAGVKAVMAADTYGGSLPLHHACHFNASINVIKFLVYVGGTESVNTKDAIGNLPLHWVLSKNGPYEAIKLLIDIGGQETVTAVNKIGWNTLHAATFFSSKFKVVKLLVDTGGPSLAKHINRKGDTPLDILYDKNPFDAPSIRLVQDQLGTDKDLMSWLPQETVERTMHWIRRQPASVQERGFNNPFIQMILNESFVKFRFLCIILLDLAAQFMLVATLSFVVEVENWYGYKDITFLSLGILIFSISWLGFRCIMEMFTTPISLWVMELCNWLNIAQTVFVIWSILILDGDGIRNDYEAGISVVTLGLVWFRSVFVLGDLFFSIAVIAQALQRIAIKLVSLSITYVFIIMGFAHMFYTAAKWEQSLCEDSDTNNECLVPSLDDSYYTAFTEFLDVGSLFRDESYFRDNASRMVLVLVFAVLVQLLLLNVLIAEIVHSYAECKNGGGKAFWQRRYHYVTEFSNIYRAAGWCESTKFVGLVVNEHDGWKIPTSRFALSTANHNVFPGDFYHFREWWMKGGQTPDFITRVVYFMKWASFEEMLMPGPSFERVISGSKKDASNYSARIFLYLIFPIMIVLNLFTFILGLATFGLLWPKWMKKILFSGKVTFESGEGEVMISRHMDVMKNEIKSIHNAVKAEKFVVKSMERDMKRVRHDLKALSTLMRRSDDESIYSEDVSDNVSDSSSGV